MKPIRDKHMNTGHCAWHMVILIGCLLFLLVLLFYILSLGIKLYISRAFLTLQRLSLFPCLIP